MNMRQIHIFCNWAIIWHIYHCFSTSENWVSAVVVFGHMPYSCSHFYFDINFGNRLYSKEKRPGSPLLFWIQSDTKFDIKVKVTTWTRQKNGVTRMELNLSVWLPRLPENKLCVCTCNTEFEWYVSRLKKFESHDFSLGVSHYLCRKTGFKYKCCENWLWLISALT